MVKPLKVTNLATLRKYARERLRSEVLRHPTVGSGANLARLLGMQHRQGVYQWKTGVGRKFLERTAQIVGLPPDYLRPDLAELRRRRESRSK